MEERSAPIKSLKQGSFVMDGAEPCKVVGFTKGKTGRHGASKVTIDCVGLFDGRRHNIQKPGVASVSIPVIDKRKGQLISVSGDIAQLMDLEDYSTFEATVPEDLKGKMEPGGEVAYWKIAGKILLRGNG